MSPKFANTVTVWVAFYVEHYVLLGFITFHTYKVVILVLRNSEDAKKNILIDVLYLITRTIHEVKLCCSGSFGVILFCNLVTLSSRALH